LALLMTTSLLALILTMAAVVGVIAGLRPDYKLHDPPQRITNAVFRPDLLTPAGDRCRKIAFISFAVFVISFGIGWGIGLV
jgi:hypothetical protein